MAKGVTDRQIKEFRKAFESDSSAMVAQNAVSNADLSLSLGIAKTAKFGGSTFDPRVWNGKICYSKPDVAAVGHYGWGCGGTKLGIPQWSWDAPPKIGTTFRASITGMNPAGGPVFWWVGLINPGGLDMSALGMPGCALFTFPIATTVAFSQRSGSAGLRIKLGNVASLVGAQASNQIGAIDASANALGVSMTDAVAFRVGN